MSEQPATNASGVSLVALEIGQAVHAVGRIRVHVLIVQLECPRAIEVVEEPVYHQAASTLAPWEKTLTLLSRGGFAVTATPHGQLMHWKRPGLRKRLSTLSSLSWILPPIQLSPLVLSALQAFERRQSWTQCPRHLSSSHRLVRRDHSICLQPFKGARHS